MRFSSISRVLPALAVMGFASSLYASAIPPGGLNPGDHYRVIFISSATGDATSPDISHYNTLVDSVANGVGSDLASLGATWVVVGSTPTVNALTNIGTFTSPLYNTAGLLVATNSTALWSGTLSNAVGYDENGNSLLSQSADTGTNSSGAGASGYELGSSDPSGVVFDGQANSTTSSWVSGGLLPRTYKGRHFYGISSEITFGALAGVPEPGTFGLMLMGAILTAGVGRSRRRSGAR
jgi:hypothetical protein